MNQYRIAALCGCFLLALGALAEDGQQAGKPKPKPIPAPLTVPAGAVKTDAYTYAYTDGQGKKWIYRETPFGVTRFEPRDTTAADREEQEKVAALIHAFDEGEFVRFERPSPFGVYRWKQKKSELSVVERLAWDRARSGGAREKE
jgi:hypothetical protein